MTEIRLFGQFGSEITSRDIADQLSKARGQALVRINSGGGSMFEGLAIHQALLRHGNVTVDIEGAALSAAALVAMAGRKIRMTPASLMMIHLPFNLSGGSVADHESSIEMLKRAEVSTVGIFANRTGLPEDQIRSMLERETWMGATEAIELGFADELIENTTTIAADFCGWDRVVDHVQSQLQQNSKLTVTRAVASTEAVKRFPELRNRFVREYNEAYLAKRSN